MEKKLSNKDRCPVCNSTTVFFEFKTKSQDNLFNTKETTNFTKVFNFFKCRKCSSKFVNPPPAEKELIEIYQKIYQPKSEKTEFKTHKSFLTNYLKDKQHKILTDKIGLLGKLFFFPLLYTTSHEVRIVKKHFAKKIRLLDIGCGTGQFIGIIKKYFSVKSALGIDFSDNSIKICKKKGINAVNCNITDIQDRYNLITAIHVLEHISNPIEFVTQIEEKLEAGGILILSLPNTKSIGRILFGKNWIGFNTPRHIVNYSKKTLFFLIEHANLKIVDYSTRGFYIDSFDLILNNKIFTGRFRLLHRLINTLPGFLFFNSGDEQTIVAIKGEKDGILEE